MITKNLVSAILLLNVWGVFQEPKDSRWLELGKSLRGELTDAAPQVHTPTLDAKYSNVPVVGVEYRIQVETSGTYCVELRSFAFDAYLVLRDATGELLIEDDDGLLVPHARIVAKLQARTTYRLSACALLGERGQFDLSLSPGAPATRDPAQHRAAKEDDIARWLSDLEEKHGPERVDLANALNSMGVTHWNERRLEKAELMFARVLALREKALHLEPLDVATSQNNLAAVYDAQGRYTEAEVGHKRALEIREAVLGPKHSDVASSLNNLAVLYGKLGRYADAELLHERVRTIWKEVYGPDDPNVAISLNNHANLYQAQGRYGEAEPLYERALAIREKSLDSDDPRVAESLGNLAILYQAQGRYSEAEPLLERALAIDERSLSPDHYYVAGSLNNLAGLYLYEGRYADAEPLFRRALAIVEAVLRPDHPDVATSLNNLAEVYRAQSRFAEAEPLLERALAIRIEALGPEHSDVALVQNNLALLYWSEGRIQEAESLLELALPIREKALGLEHPGVAVSVSNLASFYQDQGRYAEAEPLLERAVTIFEVALGSEHLDVAVCLNKLAEFYVSQGRHDEARPLFARALGATLDHLARELPVMSEPDRFRLLARARGPDWLFMSGAQSDRGVGKTEFDLGLRWKGMVTRMQAAGLALSRHEGNVEIRKRIGAIQSLQKRLSTLVFLPESERSDDHTESVAALREERLKLERELNRELEIDSMLVPPTGAELQEALTADSVLLDFYVDEDVFAWVLRPGAEDPKMVALGKTTQLRGAQEALLEQIVQQGETAEFLSEQPCAELRRLLWEPLRRDVGDAATVLVSPDGFLCELPFGVLQEEDDSYLLEKHQFVYLSDATRIVECDAEAMDREGAVLAVGNVDYQERGEIPPGFDAAGRTRSRVDHTWPPLTGTQKELQSVRSTHARLSNRGAAFTQLDGKAASEEVVRKELPGKRYLHFATHGYFEPDHLPSLMRDAEEKRERTDIGEQIHAVGLLPGLLSGLVLAGANAEADPEREDGYLSAEELMYLDISTCDLAVLSACQTALGSERAGNGLMSLRRAFEVAGAKTVVSSLWKVHDLETTELMMLFYENYWIKEMDKAKALHEAKLRMLRKKRAKYNGDARPYTWGAFVLSGYWK